VIRQADNYVILYFQQHAASEIDKIKVKDFIEWKESKNNQ